MKRVGCSIEDEDYYRLFGMFRSVYDGLKTGLEGFLHLNELSRGEILGYWSKNEMNLFIEIISGTVFDVHTTTMAQLLEELEQVNRQSNVFNKYNIAYSDVKTKIEALTEAQVFFLVFDITAVWGKREEIDEETLHTMYACTG